jgi:hypothetical protein
LHDSAMIDLKTFYKGNFFAAPLPIRKDALVKSLITSARRGVDIIPWTLSEMIGGDRESEGEE